MKREALLLVLIVAFAATIRIYWNDISHFSPADETVYTSYAGDLLEHGFIHGYPGIAHWFDEERMWRSPNPLRFGYLALATIAMEMYGSVDPRALAWLSTLAGILIVPLLFLLGRRLFDERTGLLAAAFGAVSSIELGLGRRALQDEVFCLAILVALMLVFRAVERGTTMDIIAGAAALTAAISIKESTLLLYPAFLAIAAAYRKPRPRHLVMFAIPPIAAWTIFTLLARDAGAFVRIGARVWGATASHYVLQYQGGPPHRILLDLFITSPLVSLLATAAIAYALMKPESEPRERALALFVVLAVAALAVLPSKNLRFAVIVDPAIRLLAAWQLAKAVGDSFLVAFAAANAAIELEIFHRVFITGAVYDPVTQVLLETLGAVPRANPAADPPMLFPWICAVIAAATWIWHRMHHRRYV